MLIFLLVKLSFSVKYAEFRFWQNYGQVLFDRSLNNRHAVNGKFQYIDDKDCVYTDRGFYLPDEMSLIRLPKNDYSTKIEQISTPYQVVFWFCYTLGSGRYAYRYSENSFWILYLDDTNNFKISIQKSKILAMISGLNTS